jgi:hypothetical protein
MSRAKYRIGRSGTSALSGQPSQRAEAKRQRGGRSVSMSQTSLTPKQQRFVAEYRQHRDPGAAYRLAGYRAKDPTAGARRLLRMTAVKAAIESADRKRAMLVAEGTLVPSVQGAATIREYSNRLLGELQFKDVVTALGSISRTVVKGKLNCGEVMLAVQAHTLDAIFNRMARFAAEAEYLNQAETYLKLALRAQAQCRATWEAISAIQNPPVVGYVNQANIAHNQQVNNGAEAPRAREEDAKPPIKLLEQTNHVPDKWLDRRAAQATGGMHPAMAAVGAIDRSENGKRES